MTLNFIEKKLFYQSIYLSSGYMLDLFPSYPFSEIFGILNIQVRSEAAEIERNVNTLPNTFLLGRAYCRYKIKSLDF